MTSARKRDGWPASRRLAMAALLISACASEASRSPPSSPSEVTLQQDQHQSSAEPRDESPERRQADAGAASPVSDDEIERAIAQAEAEDDSLALRSIAGCNELEGADQCTEVGAIILMCHGLGNLLSEDATARLVSCLSSFSGGEALCGTGVVRHCGLEAIEGHAHDASVATLCGDLLQRCAPPPGLEDVVTPERCLAGLSALRPRARQEFSRCMRDGCDLRLCLGGLL